MVATRPAYPPVAWLALSSGLAAGVAGPIVIREAQIAGMPSLLLIFSRLTLASLLMTPFILRRHPNTLKQIERNDWRMLTLAGIFFALNLICLFYAIEYTSLLVTGVLRRTSPLWIVGLEIWLLKARFSKALWPGLLLMLLGSIAVGFDPAQVSDIGSNPPLGAAVALAGAFVMGVYMLIGRAMSSKMPSLVYSWIVFAIAAVVVGVVQVVTGASWGVFSAESIFWVLAVTVITQFFGHIPLNIALKYFPATILSLLMQIAIVIAAVYGLFVYGEVPSLLQIIGSCAILVAVFIINRKPVATA